MDRIKNEMKVELDPISCNEAVARSVVTAFLMQADPSAGELADVKTAVSEAVTNCIVHAYRGRKSSRDKIELFM